MKKTKLIQNAVTSMYIERGAWEVEKSKRDAQPIMAVGFTQPVIKYLPGLGFSVNGVEWRYSAEYIIDHFNQLAQDYKAARELLEIERGISEEAAQDKGLPF